MKKIGIARRENIIDLSLLEFCIREELNKTVDRVMAVFDPIELIITNYPPNLQEYLTIENNPETPNTGNRQIIFQSRLWIEREDFMESPPKKYFRLSPTTKVRLKGAYIIEYEKHEKDENGNIIKVFCKYHSNSKSGNDQSGINVKGVIHWIAQNNYQKAEARIYDRLFNVPDPSNENKPLQEIINPNSLKIYPTIYIEKSTKPFLIEQRFQFIRKGYFIVDKDTTLEKPIFNQIVGLKDTWSKENKS